MLELTLNQYINEIEYLSIQLHDMDKIIEEIAASEFSSGGKQTKGFK